MTETPRIRPAATSPCQPTSATSEIPETADGSPRGGAETGRPEQKRRGEAEASQRLRVAADLLSDITKQTSLLTLNATIDAVRATGSGQGYAQVASELEDLAAQAVKAADAFSAGIADVRGGELDSVQEVAGPISQTYEVANRIAGEEPPAVSDQGTARKDAG